jgi:hypothetical protein
MKRPELLQHALVCDKVVGDREEGGGDNRFRGIGVADMIPGTSLLGRLDLLSD